jgi:hypothetical protein
MRPKIVVLFVVLVIAGAVPVWAANVTIKVTNANGDPVPSAEVDLGFGGPKATTGKDGTATAVVDDDKIDKRAVIVVTFFDPTAKRQRTERLTVTLRPTVSLQLPRFDMLPGRHFGCHMFGGAFGVGTGIGSVARNDAPFTAVSFSQVGTINNNEVFSDSGTLTADELAEQNQQEKKQVRLNSPIHVHARVPINVQPGSNPCDRSGALFVPSVYGGFGRTNVDFDSINVDSALNQGFSGGGQTMSFGGQVLFSPPSSPLLFGGGFEHFRTSEMSVDRSRPISDFFATGAQTISDDVLYQARSNSFRFTTGYAMNGVVPYGGFSVTHFTATLAQDSRIDLNPPPPGSTATTRVILQQSTRTDFSKVYTHGLAGVAIPLAGPLGLMAETRFHRNGADVFVCVGFMR